MERFFVGPDYRPFILAEGIFDFMIDQYFLVLTTIDLFVLTFMCILTKLSETLNGKQKRGFFLAFVLIGVISILEVITILVDGAPVHLRWLNILANYLGFGLSPAVSLCLVYVLDKKQGVRRGFKTAVACEAAYLISLALMLPGGMVFSVSEENLYSRGDFFAFYVTAYFAALVYLAVARQFFCETRTEFLRKNSPVLRSKSETRSLASTAPKMEGAVHVKGRVLAWGGAAFAAPPLAFCPWGSSYPSVASPASSAASWAATGSVYSDQP